MPPIRSSFTADATRVQTISACAAIATLLGWRIAAQDRLSFDCEGPPTLGEASLAQIKIQFNFHELSSRRVRAELVGSSTGIVPLPSDDIKSRLEAIPASIENLLKLPIPPAPTQAAAPRDGNPGPRARPRGATASRRPAEQPKSMWDRVASAAGEAVRASVANVEDRSFIETVLETDQSDQALGLLRGKVDSMDQVEIGRFLSTTSSLILEALGAAQSGSESDESPFFEDEMNRLMLDAQAGFPSARTAQKSDLRLEALVAIAYYAEVFFHQNLDIVAATAAGARARSGETEGADPAGTSDLEGMVNEFMKTGRVSPEMMAKLANLQDEATIDRILDKLRAAGAQAVGSEPLNIEAYFHDAPGKFELKWPLVRELPARLTFDQLDRKSQFYVLFGEWTTREFQGMSALSAGDVNGAEIIFEECLTRAAQIEVAELEARSYEGLKRVAQKRGDPQAERKWLVAALGARARAAGEK